VVARAEAAEVVQGLATGPAAAVVVHDGRGTDGLARGQEGLAGPDLSVRQDLVPGVVRVLDDLLERRPGRGGTLGVGRERRRDGASAVEGADLAAGPGHGGSGIDVEPEPPTGQPDAGEGEGCVGVGSRVTVSRHDVLLVHSMVFGL